MANTVLCDVSCAEQCSGVVEGLKVSERWEWR